tara:strand:- start:5360 stop:5965 length:606 start_codon:yes stop_codon:yes gene_type:complete
MFGGGKYGGSLSKLGGSLGSGSSWDWDDLFDFDSIIPDPIPEATTRDGGPLRRKTYKELEAEGFTSDPPRHGPGSYGASSGYEDDPLQAYDPEERSGSSWDWDEVGEALEGLSEVGKTSQKSKLADLVEIPVHMGKLRGGKQVGAGLVSSQDTYGRDSVYTAHMLRQMAHDQWLKQLLGAELMSSFSLLGKEPLSTQRLFA